VIGDGEEDKIITEYRQTGRDADRDADSVGGDGEGMGTKYFTVSSSNHELHRLNEHVPRKVLTVEFIFARCRHLFHHRGSCHPHDRNEWPSPDGLLVTAAAGARRCGLRETQTDREREVRKEGWPGIQTRTQTRIGRRTLAHKHTHTPT